MSAERPGAVALRPIQFLGNKTRTLAAVTAAAAVGLPSGATVWDAFSGSSVVGQGLASRGMRVVATDALASSATFARALLGVGADSTASAGALVELVDGRSRFYETNGPWQEHLAEEAAALSSGDGAALLQLGTRLPQRWRGGAWPSGLSGLFQASIAAAGLVPVHAGLLSTVYAGTYFGLHQAIRLEALLAAVHDLHQSRELDQWTASVLQTAICAAASEAVFSAGKHFAQAHLVREGKSTVFHAKRCLRDRRIVIDDIFAQTVKRILSSARPSHEGHEVYCLRVEDLSPTKLREWGVSSVYADPPYTAQQYSRFYHVLETMIAGVPPRLQEVGGAVTRGLYPEGRYLSPFCSKRKAPAAFAALAELTRTAGARLVISYSASLSGKTGNARTLTLDDLVAIFKEKFGQRHVTVERLTLRYRQFNRADAETAGRDDPEFLIIGGADVA